MKRVTLADAVGPTGEIFGLVSEVEHSTTTCAKRRNSYLHHDMFSKRPHELTSDDISVVCRDAWQENAEVELKKTLPARTGSRDPWLVGKDHIGDKARNEILAEVIAFANAHGGYLLLGIEESKDRPARAMAINALPKCVDLAERLHLQCRDCIEPQVPLIEVAGVPTQEDGSGVVVFRVPQSRLAPHRHQATRECYVRRADRTEKMTMREIQDLTLQVERGLGAVDKAFGDQRQAFSKRFDEFKMDNFPTLGIRATLLPLVPLFIDRVHHNPAVQAPDQDLHALRDERQLTLGHLVGAVHWRPILRGTQGGRESDDAGFLREVYCNGLIEYTFLREMPNVGDPHRHGLPPEWVMAIVGNALCAAEMFRQAAGAPEVEYGLEVELNHLGGRLPIEPYGGGVLMRELGPFPQGSTIFPRYSIGSPAEFRAVAALVERDFWEAAGVESGEAIQIDFDTVLTALRAKAAGI